MELDHSSREKADHQVHVTWSTTTTSSDDQDSAGHTRSYRCSFCQRGFSNAQALGGHMNIHRKDRARLKEFSSDKTTLSLDTMMTTTKNQSPHPPLQAPVQESSCSSVDERCSSQKRPSTTSPIETDSDTGDIGKEDLLFGDKHELQLSLSIDTSSSSNELRDESNNSRSSVVLARKHVKRNMQQQLNPGAPQTRSTTELDLELRLGPEPHQRPEQQQIN